MVDAPTINNHATVPRPAVPDCQSSGWAAGTHQPGLLEEPAVAVALEGLRLLEGDRTPSGGRIKGAREMVAAAAARRLRLAGASKMCVTLASTGACVPAAALWHRGGGGGGEAPHRTLADTPCGTADALLQLGAGPVVLAAVRHFG